MLSNFSWIGTVDGLKYLSVAFISSTTWTCFLSESRNKEKKINKKRLLNDFKLRSLLAVHNSMSWNDRKCSKSVTFRFVVILHHISASYTMYNLYFIYNLYNVHFPFKGTEVAKVESPCGFELTHASYHCV